MPLRALVVARHPFLSDHLGRLFAGFGLDTVPAVGLAGAVEVARTRPIDLVVCDYDLLAVMSLETWEQDELLSRVPVVAVSLTRRVEEVHLLDVNGIAGFLYLPTLDRATAHRALAAVRPAVAPEYSLPASFAAGERQRT